MTTLRGVFADKIEAWGQPWHGKMNASGVLDLGGGKTKTSTVIPAGGQAQLVQFAGLPVPTDKACDTAVGASWKNWAILAGHRRQYMPLYDFTFGANSWLYRTADGTVWCLQVFCDAGSTPVVQARNLNTPGAWWVTLYTGLAAYKTAIVQMTDAETTYLSASKTGDKALLNLNQDYTFSSTLTNNANWIATYAIVNQPVSQKFAEITVTGGSLTTPPSVSVGLLTADEVFTREPYTIYSTMTVRDRAKWLVGAWLNPDGVVVKSHMDVDITRSLTGNGSSWSALSGATVIGKLSGAAGDVEILNLSASMTISSGGGYTSYSTTSTPPGGTTSTFPEFSISHSASLDGAVQKIQSQGVARVFGGIGGQINPITSTEYSVSTWCQHPITGELTTEGHFF